MKMIRIKRFFLFFLMSVTLLLLCGCGTSGGEITETTAAEISASDMTSVTTVTEIDPDLIPLVADGKALYRIVRAEKPSDLAVQTAQAVYKYFVAQCDVTPELTTDWVRRDSDPDAQPEFEILVGETNRTASTTALGEITGDTWCVAMVGDRIVINASSNLLLEDALEYFKYICQVVNGVLMLDTSKCKVEVIPNALMDADITLRVGTYNIKHGAEVGLDMSVLAADIKAADLDIVGLQEVDIATTRVNGLDTLKLLAEATGYEYYRFTKAIDHAGGEYGTAILSRYPIVSYETVALETASGYEARAFGHARIEVNGAEVSFFNTHLSYEKQELRDVQFAQLAEAANVCRGYIVTGDFNTANLSEFKVFTDAVLVNKGTYATFPSSSSAIDNIVLESGWVIVDSGMVANGHSDHNLLWAEIHYEG